jgi:hypothetical protein
MESTAGIEVAFGVLVPCQLSSAIQRQLATDTCHLFVLGPFFSVCNPIDINDTVDFASNFKYF